MDFKSKPSRGVSFLPVLFALAATFFTLPVFAEEYHLKFVPFVDPKQTISGLEWSQSEDTQKPVLQTNKELKEEPVNFVKLQGSYTKGDRSLIYENHSVQTGRDGKFFIEVPIKGSRQEFEMLEIDEEGNLQSQKSELLFPDWDQYQTLLKPLPQKKWSASPGLGMTLATYHQPGITSFIETALMLKVTGEYFINSRWDIGGNIYYAVPVTTSQLGLTLQFFGFALQTGFKLLHPERSWGLRLVAGFYYNTTFASSGFGYHNVQGPQMYPVLSKRFSGNKSAWIYFKYSPIFSSKGIVNFASGEIAMGGGYLFKTFSNGRGLGAHMDIAVLSLQIGSSSTVRSNTYTLGANFRF